MRSSSWTPSIVPNGDDQTVYLVKDDLGRLGSVWREADAEAADLKTVITDPLTGQYKDPARVVAFNTAEGWSQDVSEDVAQELLRRCDLELRDVPSSIQDFVESHERQDRINFRSAWSEGLTRKRPRGETGAFSLRGVHPPSHRDDRKTPNLFGSS